MGVPICNSITQVDFWDFEASLGDIVSSMQGYIARLLIMLVEKRR